MKHELLSARCYLDAVNATLDSPEFKHLDWHEQLLIGFQQEHLARYVRILEQRLEKHEKHAASATT